MRKVSRIKHTTYRAQLPVRFLPLVCTALMLGMSGCYGPVFEERKPETPPATEGKHDLDAWLKGEAKDIKQADAHDPEGKLSREDYYNLFFKNTKHNLDNDTAQAPKLMLPGMNDLMMAPEEPAIPDDKLVTLMVTDDVPLKDVLVELARRADVDMEIDPKITGGIILSARDKPFSEVIQRISDMGSLKYSFDRGVLKVERDLPQVHNYHMNMLNLIRTSTSDVTSGTKLGEGSEGSNSGSTSTIKGVADQSDLWAMVQEGVNNILARYQAPGAAAGGERGSEGAGGGNNANAAGSSGVISLNRQAGIISVMATDRQHKAIKEYLDSVHASQSAQVLIEAKVMEVTLNDEFRSGINWEFLNNNVTGITAAGNFSDIGNQGALASNSFTAGILPTELFGFDKTSITAAIELVEHFGSTRTLSSPRISAMNNQQATLTFAENFVYFELDVQQSQDTGTGGTGQLTTTIDTTINTVPVGVILNILPSIDLERNEVILNVRPTLTRIAELKEDPGFTLQAAQLGVSDLVTEVPVVDVRELDSVMRVKNGQVMVIGGLMEEKSENIDRGIPGLSKIPLLGNAFKSVQRVGSVVETVIFIKATIVPGEGVGTEDKTFYNKFSVDHRPLKF